MASIRKRGNTYQITVSNGRTPEGKQIIETTTYIPDPAKTPKQNERALQVFALEFENRVKNGTYLDGEKITFQEFSKRWMKEYAPAHLKATSIEFYQHLLDKHILPSIGNIKLAKLQPAAINKLYNSMREHRTDGKAGGYSPATIKRVHATISTILTTAVYWNIITDNPCSRLRPPKLPNVQNQDFFTQEQTASFLVEIDAELAAGQINLQQYIFLQLCLFCGMRRGEVVALLWSDIDFEHSTISITKSTTIVQGKAHTEEPKNKTSIRTISAPDHIMDLLRRYRIEYNTYRLSIGSQWVEYPEGEFIFIQWNGSQMYPSTPYNVFKKVIKRYNNTHTEQLPEITLHGLRHTSATLLISENVDIRTVSNRLGHAQTSTTMNIYSHALKKKDEMAADTLEKLLHQA